MLRSLHLQLLLLTTSFMLNACTGCEPKPKPQETPGSVQVADAKNQQLIATFTTNLGTFKVQLFHDKVPKTVGNFVTLARSNFYKGKIFHRVIKDFMIQGGDPTGTGRGDPGYRFADEFHPELIHDRGVLSMANAGPDTNGSQFFITLVPTPHLNGKHSVFGKVIEGMDVIDKIAVVETDPNDRPKQEVVIQSLDVPGDWYVPVPVDKL